MNRLVHKVALRIPKEKHNDESGYILCTCGEVFENYSHPVYESALTQMSAHLKEKNSE